MTLVLLGLILSAFVADSLAPSSASASAVPIAETVHPDSETKPFASERMYKTQWNNPAGSGDATDAASEIQSGNPFRVLPFRFTDRPGYDAVTTDSLMRWHLFLDPYEWYSKRSGAITARRGGYGRPDGLQFYGHDNTAHQVLVDGMDQRNPVTGTVHFNRLPHLRVTHIEEHSWGLANRSHMEQRRYYVNKPLTRIHIDHTAAATRSTEAVLAMNLSRKTGFDVSYWGKNSDGAYARSAMTGRTVNGKMYHYLDRYWVLQAQVLYSGHQNEESGGYQIADMAAFDFQPIGVLVVTPGARASERSLQLQVSAWRRTHDDAPASWFFSAHHNQYRRFYFSQTDTTFYRILEMTGTVRNHSRLAGLDIQSSGSITTSHADPQRRRSLGITHWLTGEASSDLSFNPFPWMLLNGGASLTWRSDGVAAPEIRARFTTGPDWWKVWLSAATGSTLPTIQQRYWRSGIVSGQNDLAPTRTTRLEGGTQIAAGPFAAISFRAYYQQAGNPVYLAPDSVFRAYPAVASVGGVFDISTHSTRIESGYSITIQTYESSAFDLPNQLLDGGGLRIWNRAHLYWKGYLFNRAAYVKTGFSGIFSPNPYRAMQYIPSAGYWDPAQDVASIPFIARLDGELSARIRNMFVYAVWEDLLQGTVVSGSFETQNYPMPGNRIRFGMRVLFRN